MHPTPPRVLAARFGRFVGGACALVVSLLHAQPAASPALAPSAWNPATASLDFSRARTTAPTARLANLSIRARAGGGADTLIAGAVIEGSGTMPMLVRAIGPGLARFGLSTALRDPRLQIFHGTEVVAQTQSVAPMTLDATRYVGAFPAQATGDAALVGQAGAGMLTAHCSSAATSTGVALLEFYDATAVPAASSARFINLSSRARVEPGEGTIVIGFVVTGEGRLMLLLRGVGATLGQFGVADTLTDPRIELFAGTTRIAANDNWREADVPGVASVIDAHIAVGAFGLTSDRDAAMVVTLPAGAYTLQVSGAAGQSGVALAEMSVIATTKFDAAHSTNAVGLDVFGALSRSGASPNLIISPYSIESALALAYAGADGPNREEMARVLRLPSTDAELQVGFAELRRALQAAADDTQAIANQRTREGRPTAAIEWSEANRLFGQQDYPFHLSFLTLMRDGFGSPLESVDFVGNASGVRSTINRWVEQQTRDKIRDLIPPDGLNRKSRLVLINALYFKSVWDTAFQKSATQPRPFYLTPNNPLQVPTMTRTGSMGYTTGDGFTVVTLDYLGREFQLVIMLPDPGLPVDTAAARLTTTHFSRWAGLGNASRHLVTLFLPRFKVEGTTLPLGSALRSLGMAKAFDTPPGTADFTRIAPPLPEEYLALSDVYHRTFVALDEEGTEAAAATAVVATATTTSAGSTPLPIIVRVERPFLFAIQHRSTGACLFLGRISNPL